MPLQPPQGHVKQLRHHHKPVAPRQNNYMEWNPRKPCKALQKKVKKATLSNHYQTTKKTKQHHWKSTPTAKAKKKDVFPHRGFGAWWDLQKLWGARDVSSLFLGRCGRFSDGLDPKQRFCLFLGVCLVFFLLRCLFIPQKHEAKPNNNGFQFRGFAAPQVHPRRFVLAAHGAELWLAKAQLWWPQEP